MSLPLARQLLGLCVGLSWFSSGMHILSARGLTYTSGARWSELRRGRLLPALAGLTLPFVLCVEAWVMGRAQVPAALGALALLAAVRRLEERQWPAGLLTALGHYAPAAAALSGYTVVFALAGTEAAGWEGACGVMAATWVLAGIAKWRWV